MALIDLTAENYGLDEDSAIGMQLAEVWKKDEAIEQKTIKNGRQPVGQLHAPNAEWADMAEPVADADQTPEPVLKDANYLLKQSAELSRLHDAQQQRLLMGLGSISIAS